MIRKTKSVLCTDKTQQYHMRLDAVCLLKLTRKETFQADEMRYA